MASTLSFVEYACDQLSGAGEMTYKKMFGEFGIYCNGKFLGLICNNLLYIKHSEAGAAVLGQYEVAPPYNGAKPHILIEELDNRELLTDFIIKSYEALPMQKARQKKK